MRDNHYLTVLRPPRATFPGDATPAEAAAIDRHFDYLKRLLADGVLVLAGRTEDASMGLVVFKAADEASARAVMEADPAIRAGVFKGTLYPYRLALLAGSGQSL